MSSWRRWCSAMRRLRENQLIDFDDMVLIGLRLIEGHAWVRRALKARFRVLAIDEYHRTPLTRWLEQCASWCADGWRRGEPRLSGLIRRWTGMQTTAANRRQDTFAIRLDLVRFLMATRDGGTPLRP